MTTKAVEHIDEHGNESIGLTINRQDVGDFIYLTVQMSKTVDSHADHKRISGIDAINLKRVLSAMAEMVNEGSHIRDPMSGDMFGDIDAFHKKFELYYGGLPRALTGELFDFRRKFMQEELDEYAEFQEMLESALLKRDEKSIAFCLEKQFDALIDLVYVALGTAYLQGFPWGKGWDRVQKANMAKVRAIRAEEGATDSGRAKTYDVVKPAGWVAPSHMDLVSNHAHINTKTENVGGTQA